MSLDAASEAIRKLTTSLSGMASLLAKISNLALESELWQMN